MNCPFCKISSMRSVVSADRELDCCLSCGATWFDYGEIAELTEGRFAVDGPAEPVPERRGVRLAALRREARSLSCPRCGETLSAVDFQQAGVPLFRCGTCRGLLATRPQAAGLSARFRFLREHQGRYAALGETMARSVGDRTDRQYPGGAAFPPLPFVVPLADDGPAPRTFPLVTGLLIAVSLVVYAFAQIGEVPVRLPGGLAGLPPGAGLAGIPKVDLFLFPFLHGGLLPLLAGGLFLFVLGDNVEDRIGSGPFLLFYLLCGVCSGAAHLLWGAHGGPAALGSAGAVAGVVGAYLVFFPNVSIEMYGMGRIVSVPAYLFACSWIIAVFLLGRGPIANLVDPFPLSVPGHVAGFATGVLGALLWRIREGE